MSSLQDENCEESTLMESRLTEIHNKLLQLQKENDQSYLEQGRLLQEAKDIFGKHGAWLDWLRDNVDMSICKAQRLVKVAMWMDGNEAPVPHLDFSKAYILSRLKGDDLKSFLQSLYHVGGKFAKNVESMTKKELEEAVRLFLRSKGNKPPTAQKAQKEATNTLTEGDFLNRFDRIRSEVSELANLVGNDSGVYGTFASDLCELCQGIIQQLSSDEVEDS